MSDKITIIFDTNDWTDCSRTVLGEATGSQISNLQNTITKQSPESMMCLKSLYTAHQDNVFIAHSPQVCNKRHHTYALFPQFNISGKVAPCCTENRPHCQNDMLQMCAHNLRCGKCQDEFIRRTLGAALFPQFYAKAKKR